MIARIVKLLVSLCVRAVDCAGNHPHAVVLYYHDVTGKNKIRFAWQMQEVNRRKNAMVTFDDALVSMAEHALPVTEALGIPVMIFVPTAFLGGAATWMNQPYAGREKVMSAERISELSESKLITWGSHSVTHPRLSELTEMDARRELRDSRATLELLLKRPIEWFSFPHGAFSKREVELAGEEGYRQVFTIMPHKEQIVDGVQVTGRIKVDPTDWPVEFQLKLAGAYRWIAWASTTKQRLIFRH